MRQIGLFVVGGSSRSKSVGLDLCSAIILCFDEIMSIGTRKMDKQKNMKQLTGG